MARDLYPHTDRTYETLGPLPICVRAADMAHGLDPPIRADYSGVSFLTIGLGDYSVPWHGSTRHASVLIFSLFTIWGLVSFASLLALFMEGLAEAPASDEAPDTQLIRPSGEGRRGDSAYTSGGASSASKRRGKRGARGQRPGLCTASPITTMAGGAYDRGRAESVAHAARLASKRVVEMQGIDLASAAAVSGRSVAMSGRL